MFRPSRPHQSPSPFPPRRTRNRFGSQVEALEGRQLLAADTLPVLIGGAAAKSVQFVDSNGTRAIVRLLGGGSATVNFSGTGLSQGASPNGIAVTGSGVSVDSIALAGTGLGTTLQVTTIGRTPVPVGGITSNGVMAAIRAPGVVLNGDLTTAGWVHQVTLAGATGGTINIGPSHINGGLNLTLGAATDENLVSAIRIDNLTATQWASTTGSGDSITAPQVMNVRVRGTFDPDLTVTGIPGARFALQTLSAGAVTAGTWSVGGNVHTIRAGSIATGWAASVAGSVDGVNITRDASVDFTAPTVGSFVVHGTLSDSTITLTQPLRAIGFDLTNLFVGGAMVNSSVFAGGSINTVAAGRMEASGIYAGTVSPALPQTTSDFGATAQIRSVALRRSTVGASFAGSNIAAYKVGTVMLGTVATSNAGTKFGVAGHSIQSITLTDSATNRAIHMSNVPTTGAFAGLLVSKGVTPNDFVVEIV
jgi:hypothetical protein